APVVLTGPIGTVQIDWERFVSRLALPISQLVTLPWKAPITVCESALTDDTRWENVSVCCAWQNLQQSLNSGSQGSKWICRFDTDSGRGMPGSALQSSPTCRLSGSRRRSGCVPAEPYPPLEQPQYKAPKTSRQSLG